MTDLLGNVADSTDVDKRLLAEYKVISSALGRLEQGFESVEQNIALLQQRLPQTIRLRNRVKPGSVASRSCTAAGITHV